MATILIVDDLPASRKVLATLLAPHGHRIVEAANGREALSAVQTDHPDLVITDVLMPQMDGYEFVKQLRLDPTTGRIPVLFYTAPYGEREARAFSRASGLPYVLRKPSAPEQVLEIVTRVLTGAGAATPTEDDPFAADDGDSDHLRLLTDQLSEKSEDLKAANAKLRALINIGLDLAASRGTDRLVQSVCDAACDLFGATYVTLGIVDRDALEVRRFATCGSATSEWITPGSLASGIYKTIVAERRMLRRDNGDAEAPAMTFPAGHPEVQSFLAAPIASRAHVYGWICLVSNDGRPFSADDEPMVMALASQVGRIHELDHEILERKEAELARREERDRAQRYLDVAEVLLLALDLDGRIKLINRHGCAVLGWAEAELLGHHWAEMCIPPRLHLELGERMRNVIGGDAASVEHAVLTKDGRERMVEWRHTVMRDDAGVAVGTLSSGADITEQRALEAQQRQGQKMEAVGQLASGVAHDFNNLLTVILGYCELIEDDLEPGARHWAEVEEIRKASVSATSLTRQLLAVSRKQIVQPAVLNLNAVVTNLQGMLGRLIRKDIAIVLNLQPVRCAIQADLSQAEQLLINLAINARDAMPQGGKLTIETAEADVDGRPHVVLTVTDTGTGMTPQVQARIFEPFFTTKEIGRGTGLGMATVHGIVSRAGGSIDVFSKVGEGTSIKVHFPKTDATDLVALGADRRVSPSGVETVLVVEDSAELRHLAKLLLEKLGYTVLLAASADEALAIFERHSTIDLLLTDVVMPGASGPELTRQMVAQRPGLKVVFMSGYTETLIGRDGVLQAGTAFLHKPFTSETLGRKVRETLDQASLPLTA